MSHANLVHSQKITAVILAGGASSRMGSDKALLEWRDRPFTAHIVECLRTQADTIAINTNSASSFAQFGIPLIADATAEHRGPLAGILAALTYSTTTFTLIVPSDNPRQSPQLAARLFAAIESDQSDLAYAFSSSDSHYLYALIRTPLRAHLAAFLQTGDYAVRRWYASLRASRVDFSDQPEYFRNINTPEDLKLLHSS